MNTLAQQTRMGMPLFDKAYKVFELRPANRPVQHPALSGVVHIADEVGGWCLIHFSQRFIERLGLSLPYGLTADKPAALRLTRCPLLRIWCLSCFYLDGSNSVDLHWFDSLPLWCGRIYRDKKIARGKSTWGKSLDYATVVKNLMRARKISTPPQAVLQSRSKSG